MLNHFKQVFTTAKSGYSYFILILSGIAGNYLSIPLFFGVDFIFGSIPVLVAVRLYGVAPGAIAAFIASSYTYILWKHPYAIIIFTVEALFVGLFLRRRDEFRICLLDGAFWLFIGMPMVWLFYHTIMDMDILATLLIMLKQSVNGFFNAMIASMVTFYLPVKKWFGLGYQENNIELRKIIYSLSVTFVLLPSLLLMVLNGRQAFERLENSIIESLNAKHEDIAGSLGTWQQKHFHAVSLLAQVAAGHGLNSGEVLQKNTEIIKKAYPDFHNMYVADAKGTTIAFYPKVNIKGEYTVGLNFSDRSYFKESMITLKPVMSDVFMGRGGVFSPIFTIAAPVLQGDKFNGIVVGAVDLGHITKLIELPSLNDHIQLTVIDRDNKIAASTHSILKPMQQYDRKRYGEVIPVDAVTYRWLPENGNKPEMDRWKNSFYVLEKPMSGMVSWNLAVEASTAPYRDYFYRLYLSNLAVMLLLVILALCLAEIICRKLVAPLTQLAQITTNLPHKLLGQHNIEWPKNTWQELELLINNFKLMAGSLNQSIREIRNANENLRHMAFYDSLTGLPNNRSFIKSLNKAIATPGRPAAVLFVDIDNFKNINDISGHGVGDRLLKEIAKRLSNCVNNRGIVSRQGGDEFLILFSGNIVRKDISFIAESILKELSRPFNIKGYETNITASIGISIYPDDGRSSTSLVKNADIAMYSAKEKGKNNYQFYYSALSSLIVDRIQLERDLRKALEQKEFVLYYQPQIDLNTGLIIGTEALIRWKHKKHGVISPVKFIPVAENTGLIIPIGLWILRTACKQTKAWQEAGFTNIHVAVNLSARQLQGFEFVATVNGILKETGLDPGCLQLEITESTLMQNVDTVVSMLQDLKALGVQIALDDFGTGYSSLTYLQKLPIDLIKIDRSFVWGVTNNQNDKAIVDLLIELAKRLNLRIVAEGVETKEQLAFFQARRCDATQGYLYSKAVPTEELAHLLKKGSFLI